MWDKQTLRGMKMTPYLWKMFVPDAMFSIKPYFNHLVKKGISNV